MQTNTRTKLPAACPTRQFVACAAAKCLPLGSLFLRLLPWRASNSIPGAGEKRTIQTITSLPHKLAVCDTGCPWH